MDLGAQLGRRPAASSIPPSARTGSARRRRRRADQLVVAAVAPRQRTAARPRGSRGGRRGRTTARGAARDAAPSPRCRRPADVLAVGDSVAHNLAFGSEKWASNGRANATIINDGQLGRLIARAAATGSRASIEFFADSCEWSEKYPALVSGHRPDVVVLASGIWEVVDRRLPGDDRFPPHRRPGRGPLHPARVPVRHRRARRRRRHRRAGHAAGTSSQASTRASRGYLSPTWPRIDRLNDLLREASLAAPGRGADRRPPGALQQQPGGGERRLDPPRRHPLHRCVRTDRRRLDRSGAPHAEGGASATPRPARRGDDLRTGAVVPVRTGTTAPGSSRRCVRDGCRAQAQAEDARARRGR